MKKISALFLTVLLVLNFFVACDGGVHEDLFSGSIKITDLQYTSDGDNNFHITPTINNEEATVYYSIAGSDWTTWSKDTTTFTAEQTEAGISFIASLDTKNTKTKAIGGTVKSNIVKASGWVLKKSATEYKFLLKSNDFFSYAYIHFKKDSGDFKISSTNGIMNGTLKKEGLSDSQGNLILEVVDSTQHSFGSADLLQIADVLLFKDYSEQGTPTSFDSSEKKVSEEKVYGYIIFSSKAEFSISATKKWNGTLYYTTGDPDSYETEWVEWNGETVSSILSGTEYAISFRGLSNTVVSDQVKWVIEATENIECAGNIMTLLNYMNSDEATMGEYCFANMFENWTKLSKTPSLPMTNLSEYCYKEMFKGCSSLSSVSELPATDLKKACYRGMFKGCTSITTAPKLPATELVEDCYKEMFSGCSLLSNVSVNFTEWLTGSTDNWLSDTNETGIFTCPAKLPTKTTTGITLGGSTVPEGWTVVKERYTITYDANGASGTAPEDTNNPYDYNEKVSVLGNDTEMTSGSLIFVGWTTTPDGTGTVYKADQELTVTEDIKFYSKFVSGYAYQEPVYKTVLTKTEAKNGIERWDDNVCAEFTSVTATDESWGESGKTKWYVVDETMTISKTVECKGDVRLILLDGYTLTINGSVDKAAINVTGSNKLTIYGNEGKLEVTGGENGAGIGGNKKQEGKNITINGGVVTAKGGKSGAGIGGGGYADNQSGKGHGTNIVINKGVVTATGGEHGAGIGGAYYSYGKDIVVNGGTVKSTGGRTGAGIGGGYHEKGDTITINGGNVTANGGTEGAGIGGGNRNAGINITITGGTVTAAGKSSAPGIGAGSSDGGGSECYCTNISITGGTVFASAGDECASAIGYGCTGTSSNITISTNLDVKADNNKTPATFLDNSGEDLATSLIGKRYCKIEPATGSVTGITLSKTSTTLTVGGTETITATIAPTNATDKTVTWSTSAEGVATVSDGVITAIGAGSATITATATNGTATTEDDRTATCTVTVNAATISVTGVTLSKTSTTLTVGGIETITATIAPTNATDKTVTWSTSDEGVATVSDGVITAIGAGSATITATATNGTATTEDDRTATCTVTVNAATISVTGVTLSKTSTTLTVGGTETITATIAPTNATDKTVTWSTSDEGVATVSDGVITAIGAGSATITATATNGTATTEDDKTATCTVTVNAASAKGKGTAAVSGADAGRTLCGWVQLWEGGPRWAEFNVGSTISDYANANQSQPTTAVWADDMDTLKALFCKNNIGGYYGWKNTIDRSDTVGTVDTATELWGSKWKTPEFADFESLMAGTDLTNGDYEGTYTVWEWCDGKTGTGHKQYVSGCTLCGWKISGIGDYSNNSIFIPTTGYGHNTEYGYNDTTYLGTNLFYWACKDSNASFITGDSSSVEAIDLSTSAGKNAYCVRPILNEPYTYYCLTGDKNILLDVDGCTTWSEIVAKNSGLLYTVTVSDDVIVSCQCCHDTMKDDYSKFQNYSESGFPYVKVSDTFNPANDYGCPRT